MDILDIESFSEDGPNFKRGTFTPDPTATVFRYVYKLELSWRDFLRILVRHPRRAVRWLLQKKIRQIRVPGQRIHVGFQPDMVVFWRNESE